MWKKMFLVFLTLCTVTSCKSCDDAVLDAHKKSILKDSDIYIERNGSFLGVACDPECPKEEDIIERIDALQCTFKDYLTLEEAWRSLKGYKIIFTNTDYGFKGQHHPDQNYIIIYYPHPCPDRPQGLCGGVFDWEVGNAMMEIILGKQGNYNPSESQKYDFRRRHNLFYGCP